MRYGEAMKIFLSWSGERSQRIAEALKAWLPDVVSFFEPWISSEDIEKGARFEADLGAQLQATDVGIVCLCPENLTAPWVLFESGALAKSLGRSKVCTYLFDLQPSDLSGPLVQFQATTATRDDTLKLLRTLNRGLKSNARSPEQLEKLFAHWWPDLKDALDAIPRTKPAKKFLRSDREILEELLDLIRQQSRHEGQAQGQTLDVILRQSSFLGGSDLQRLVDVAELRGGPDDPNAHIWARDSHRSSDPLAPALDGIWSSRWNEDRFGEENWQIGTATMTTHNDYFLLLHTDPRFEYLMLGKRYDKGRLVGRHFNISDLRDTSPWVGLLVSPSRIDGRWKAGRWDLQRLPNPAGPPAGEGRGRGRGR